TFQANSRNNYNVESGSTTETSTSTLCNIPDTPTVTAIYGSSMTLQLDTTDNTYWTEYSIKMTSGVNSTDQYLQTGNTFAAGPVVYQSTVTWGSGINITDLVAFTSYSIYVNARNSNGVVTEYSPILTTTTLLNPTSGLYVVSRTSYSIDLEWFNNNNPSGVRYGLSLSSDNFVAHVSTFAELSENLTATTTTAYSLEANTTYWFRTWVSTEAAGDVSSYDGPISTQTSPLAPNAPTGLSVDNTQTTSTQIKWDFTDEADDEDALYISSGADTNMRVSNSLGQLPGTGSTTSYLETGLTPNTQYTRYAEAYNVSASSWSVPVNTYTDAATPENLAVDSVTKTSVKLSWSPATLGGNTRYAISRATDTGGEWSFIVTWTDELTATTTTNYGLSAGTSYFYRLYGYNTIGIITDNYDGPVSTSTVPQNDPPVISTATAIDIIYFEGNKVVIDATVTDDGGITQVTLLYRKKGETAWQETSFVPSPSTTTLYTGSAEIPGTYVTIAGVEYYIRAFDNVAYGYWKSASAPHVSTVTKTYGESVASGIVSVPDENPDDGTTSITIPAGALDSAIQMTIEQKESDDELPAVETSIDVRKNSARPIAVFEFGPDGTVFKVPVTLTMVYFDDVVTSAGVDESKLRMYWYNNGSWKPLGGTVDTVMNTVSAKTSRFSKYALFASKSVSITAGKKTFLTPYLPVELSDVSELTVYDIKGHTVVELQALSGTTIITWDGKDEDSNMVESGTYIYKAKTTAGEEKYGAIVVAK
ncbi:MAG: fibronectin type III domain-containing protein, partial [Elusimicrobia bacterium]|nr:fibronectin type III domain-containing protein [Elusimicrobiota bacterium]